MERICKITVESRRNVVSFGMSPPTLSEEEEWEEDLFTDEDGSLSDLYEEDLTSDAWKKNPSLPKPPPVSTTNLCAFGIFSHEKDGSFRLSYEDSEITGLEGCLTTFCLSPAEMLIMLRRGPVKTCMVFESGRRHLCDYGSELGFPSVAVHTHTLSHSLSEQGGRIHVRYSVDAGGALAERNELIITVSPA